MIDEAGTVSAVFQPRAVLPTRRRAVSLTSEAGRWKAPGGAAGLQNQSGTVRPPEGSTPSLLRHLRPHAERACIAAERVFRAGEPSGKIPAAATRGTWI